MAEATKKPTKMTERQKRFCDEYLIDLNATQAAIRAGYSKKTATVIAAEILTKPYIADFIAKRMAEKEKTLIATQDEVLQYLTAVMRREKVEHVVVTVPGVETVDVPDEDGNVTQQTIKTSVPKLVEVPCAIKDANKAAELLGKRYGLYVEKVENDVDVDVHITVDYGDDDEE